MYQTFRSEEELINFINEPTYSIIREFKFNFESCTFEFEVNFSSILNSNVFDEKVEFKNATFERRVSFNNMVFASDITFEDCRFEREVTFKKAIFKKSVIFHSFQESVDFTGAKFQSYTVFPKSFSRVVNLSHCSFMKTLDLSNRIFRDELSINDSFFESKVNFQSTIFKKKVNAWNTEFKKDLNFRWANFREKINLTDSLIKKGKTDFFGTNFENNGYFYNTYFAKIDLKNSVIEKGIYFLDSTIKKCNRETNRIIKNQFIKQNNRIESLKYHHREMSSYIREIIFELFSNLRSFKLWKLLKNIGDLIILCLNFLSNGFGLWWFSGIIFLFVTTSIVYHFYLLSLDLKISYTEIEYWKYYVQFIFPTHKHNLIVGTNMVAKSYIIDYFGRIISSFGIYQTIQAFRKFGKV